MVAVQSKNMVPENDPSIKDILTATELFADLSADQIDQVAEICEMTALERGDILFAENTASDEMYVIGRGVVEILVDPNLVNQSSDLELMIIARLVPGDLLGEMALVDQGLRSATARSGENGTILLRLPREPLLNLCQAQPELGFALMYNLAADMALKIRNTGLTLRQYQLQLMYRSSQ